MCKHDVNSDIMTKLRPNGVIISQHILNHRQSYLKLLACLSERLVLTVMFSVQGFFLLLIVPGSSSDELSDTSKKKTKPTTTNPQTPKSVSQAYKDDFNTKSKINFYCKLN